MTPHDIPESWHQTLKTIQAHAPEAFIGGGALRDLINDRPVKDIDVFIPAFGYSVGLEQALNGLGYDMSRRVSAEYIGSDPTVFASHEYTSDTEIDLNLILLSSGYEFPTALERFDFGLCQVGFDGTHIMATPAFEEDVSQRILTVRRADDLSQLERTRRRYARLHQKYPGYALIVPPEFNHSQ